MDKETVNAVVEGIRPVAEKIGEGAEALYGIYVRQMYAEGIAVLVLSILGLVSVLVYWLVVKKFWKTLKDDEDLLAPVMIAGFFYTLIVCGLCIGGFWTGTLKTINPHYYAIERIVNQVRGNDN